MSYSRWSFSRWYTYYGASSDDTINGQIFCVCDVDDFTYGELKDDIEKCLDRACNKNYTKPTIKERAELKEYMEYFMDDVKRDNLK